MSTSNNRDYSNIYLIVIIIVIAAFLRLLFLSTIPNGFYFDEASNAYDSYSILTTLRDRHGEFLPLFVRAFGEYKESVAIFLTVPFIKIFGLNEFSARCPSAFIGVLTLLVLYYLVKECFERRTALIATLLLAINPWHIHFSRIAFRAILLPCLFSLGLLLFVKSFKKPTYLPLSGFVFGLSLYTYHSARVFVPFFLLGLVVIFWEHLWQNKKETLIGSILFLIIFIPLVFIWISPEGMARAKEIQIVTEPFTIIKYYLSYFSPSFLFLNGDPNYRHSALRIGELYYYEIITVAIGMFYLFREKRKERAILLLWLFLYPLPAAITAPGHAIRAIVGIPAFIILSAYGVERLMNIFRLKGRKSFLIVTGLIFVASVAILTKRYFIDYPLYATTRWQYGIREAITWADKSSYSCAIMSDRIMTGKVSAKAGSISSYHAFTVLIPFYTSKNPAEYQLSSIEPWVVGKSQGKYYSMDKYKLISISEASDFNGYISQFDCLNNKCLFILRPWELETLVPENINYEEVHVVRDRSGVEHFKLVEIQSK